jgi:hypothetical protein
VSGGEWESGGKVNSLPFSFSPDQDEFNNHYPGQERQAKKIRGAKAGRMGYDPAE